MLTITKLEPKEAYSIYLEKLDARLENLNSLLIDTRRRINYIANQLVFVGDSFGLRNDLYVKVKHFTQTGAKLSLEYLQEINFKNLSSHDWFISKNPIITTYFKSFVLLSLEEYGLINTIESMTKGKIDYKTYYRILTSYYASVANRLFKGEEYVINRVGTIKVVCKGNKLSTGVKFKVNWGESFKLLKLFASKNYPQIYAEFLNRTIDKRTFIDRMKPYTYDEQVNPTGFKWLVHLHKRESLWLILYKKHIDTKYNIIPSNFIMNATRSQIDFTNNVKSTDEIIESNELGFRDKLNCLVRFDPNYINNFVKL